MQARRVGGVSLLKGSADEMSELVELFDLMADTDMLNCSSAFFEKDRLDRKQRVFKLLETHFPAVKAQERHHGMDTYYASKSCELSKDGYKGLSNVEKRGLYVVPFKVREEDDYSAPRLVEEFVFLRATEGFGATFRLNHNFKLGCVDDVVGILSGRESPECSVPVQYLNFW